MKCPGGVRLHRATTGYPGFKLGPLDLEARPGEVLALIGPNASGKTTLLRLLAGILPLHSGEAEVCGRRVGGGARIPGGELVAYAPAVPQLDPWATVAEALKAAGAKGEAGWVSGILNRRIGELSSGQRRLADLARALGQGRPVLLVDEPLAFLDVKHQTLVINALRGHASEGGVVVVAMHELHMTSLLADRVAVIHQGRLAAHGRPGEALNPKVLEPIYQARLQEVETPWGRVLLPKP